MLQDVSQREPTRKCKLNFKINVNKHNLNFCLFSRTAVKLNVTHQYCECVMIHRCSELSRNLLFLKANSSSDCFLSGLRFGRSFFTLLGLLLRSCRCRSGRRDGQEIRIRVLTMYTPSSAVLEIVTWTCESEKCMNLLLVRLREPRPSQISAKGHCEKRRQADYRAFSVLFFF